MGLVLAGIGDPQRFFVEDLEEALYGSIPQLELKPFDWELDRRGSQQLACRTGWRWTVRTRENSRKSRSTHTNFSAGHPYYLAILGYATAIDLRGHWYPHRLDQVVERIIQGTLRPDELVQDSLPYTFQEDVFRALDVGQTLTKRLPGPQQAGAGQDHAGSHRPADLSELAVPQQKDRVPSRPTPSCWLTTRNDGRPCRSWKKTG